ncbi:EsV-1-106 [Ectocarpus siliculosus virus 1]|uniref:EsV-1-106 n=1 Tax=Ectocarpus siliculosus virus 1 (isolate New Zealand/Kaikoura/1988) TaxID=654926 RepID=Q8QNH2_ESV1K|nr:EsV-1-106 [Ectocarpus siliculosus virus 1]AAK14524.1 EsV-1-106 [Ectocarpus siliculosus virus 1]
MHSMKILKNDRRYFLARDVLQRILHKVPLLFDPRGRWRCRHFEATFSCIRLPTPLLPGACLRLQRRTRPLLVALDNIRQQLVEVSTLGEILVVGVTRPYHVLHEGSEEVLWVVAIVPVASVVRQKKLVD